MNQNHQEFEDLRKLMALKRHEQPPPEYLTRLHDNIIARIEEGEGEAGFWERFTSSFSLRPGMVYAFGLTMCSAVGLSSLYMFNDDNAQTAQTTRGIISRPRVLAPAYASETAAPSDPAITLHVANWLRYTNPSVETPAQLTLFDTAPRMTPVSFEPGR
jgi:hypothetical protein